MKFRVRRRVRRTFFLRGAQPLAAIALTLAIGLALFVPSHAGITRAERSPAERIADTGFRLALAGVARCPELRPTLGLTFQHLDQFEATDRPALLQTIRLDLGPAILAVARSSPAEHAGIRRDDILLTIDEIAAPAPDGIGQPFDQQTARAISDRIDDQLDAAAARNAPVRLQVLRGDRRLSVTVQPIWACPSRIHLARSNQQNAFADGEHVVLTTGLLNALHMDDELAFVLGHEMAHNILHHAALLRAQGVPRKGMGRVLGKNGQTLRATERAADLLGGQLALDAGYDLYAGAAVLRSLNEGIGISFLAAHDSARKRIKAVRSLVGKQPWLAAGPTTQE